ncbi:FAD-binding oxidoreductase [Cyanobium sp. Morenito 9A2]|uniref:FAD-binding oxidoreductase n=1 Tax=Cyanobium sp. Morenito 9A2 TaxID=2823718 RepID=UPI0020CC74BC|nr:FAD-binding oxidoreductase [Cyanobium sp. Morenito 9A2]MCP9849536.1 FAD-binding oxidoreductase [Cyanobium sp. Morenito 9A2]
MITPDPRELPELVRQLHAEATPWLPAGHGSRLHWGPPSPQTTVVSCRRLNRLIDHAVGDFTVTVQAGLGLKELQQTLAEQHQWLAMDWPWGSGADGSHAGSVGGLVARGLAGGLRQRHLGVRDQVIGLGLLRSDGTAAHAGGRVVKNVAGYDLMRLFTGSWGSLGLITELTLRTTPVPPQRRGLLLLGESSALERLRRWLLSSSLTPELIDLWGAALTAEAGLEASPALLISLASVSAEALAEQIAAIGTEARVEGVRAQPLDSERLEALRALGLGDGLLSHPAPQEGRWLLRLGVLPAHGLTLLDHRLLRSVPVSLGAGSGLGLAWAAAGSGPGELARFHVQELRRRCTELGGYLTVLEQPEKAGLAAWGDAPDRPLIEALKRQFDPRQQLARGRLPGVAQAGVSL